MNRVRTLVATVLVAGFLSGCGGGGGGSSSFGSLTLVADFADPTRQVPGYASELRVTVTPPLGLVLPGSLSSPFVLTRSSPSRVLNRLVPSASPYGIRLEALTDGSVVASVDRTVFVTSGQPQQIDVSANLQSEIASVSVEGAQSATIGTNVQFTAHAKDADGKTLFSGSGFGWTSSNPPALFIDLDSGLGIPRNPGVTTVRAALKGTTLFATIEVAVSTGGEAAVTIDPPATVVLTNGQRQFAASVTGLPGTSVTWSVEGAGGGIVSSTGLYTAPSGVGTFTLRATSQIDPSKSGAATVIVQASSSWSVVNLHPSGASASEARGVNQGKQVGFAQFAGAPHAGIWSGSSATWLDLNPESASASYAWDYADGQTVGVVEIGSEEHASLWTGSAASWVDLHPPTATNESFGYGASAGLQTGTALVAGNYHAGIWNGTAASFVDLHPVGEQRSFARDADGGRQVGHTFSGTNKAALWSGSAASWVSLQPEELGDLGSFAFAIHGTQQVGQVSITGPSTSDFHASLWTGTAASWVDLHPPGLTTSSAHGVFNGMQVGNAFVGGYRHAALWRGSPSSWVDLHAYLPAHFRESHAQAVWSDGSNWYIVGYGFNTIAGRNEALMWVSPV